MILSSDGGCTSGAAPAAGAFRPPPDFAAWISRATTRPCGPEPCTRARSILPSLASRLASGEAKVRSPFCAGTPSPGAFGADLSPPGRGEGALPCGEALPAPSPRGGEGWGEGVSAEVFCSGLPAAAAVEAAAFTSSPSPASTAITWLTGTSCVPSGTTIFASVPSSTASTSIVALSVSISASTSPGATLSPSFLIHLARLPFSMVGERAGIRILVGMARPTGSRRL